MPRERESELRMFEGKALQMHSSCVKKMPATHRKEVSEFDVLSDLKDLSDKADQLAEEKLSDDPGLEEWFASIRKTMINIRDCKNIKDVEYPPSILTFTSNTDKTEKDVSSAIETTPVLNMTASVAKEVTTTAKVVALSTSKMITPTSKIITSNNKLATSNTQMVTPSSSVRKKLNPFTLLNQLTNSELNSNSNGKYLKNSSKLLPATPVLNRTFDKINITITQGSGSATNVTANDSGIITRSGSKRRKENECPSSHEIVTRSGSKRKSSVSKNKSSKKQKIDSQNISSATLNKTAQLRHPLRDLKTSVLAQENKKISAIIKPPVLQKQPVVPKEQQILEEIKKKEKKIEENMQRLKAERKQKAEQTKKNREEKRTKTLQKRLQMEKEKEEKREVETKKSQVKIIKENPKKTTRAKELVEQHIKESKSSIISSTTQSTNQVDSVVQTPANRKSDDIESYELTPVPDSSTYNFSDDDDDDRSAKKRIPLWAQGVHLKSALMQQFYYPVDTDMLFGNDIETPNLVDIFKINKKRYFKRTSSAIWNKTPDRTYNF